MPVTGYTYIDVPFALDGTTTPVPDAVQSNGSVSFTQGYGPNYELAQSNPSCLNIEQAKMNYLFNLITTVLQQWQQQTIAPWISHAANGGSAFSYGKYAQVLYTDGHIYESLVANNTTDPVNDGVHWVIVDASATTASIAGVSSKLTGAWASTTTATWTANQVGLQNSSGGGIVLSSYSQTLSTATSGAGGLDTGSLAASTFYYVYAIYNPTTPATSILFSLSSTAPTLPSGYTYSALIGVFKTDGSSHIIGFTQQNKDFQYQVGSNLSALPQMASGTTGSVTTPTWTGVGTSSFIPSLAKKGKFVLSNFQGGGTNIIMVAPNSSYGAYTNFNNPPLSGLDTSGGPTLTVSVEFLLESTSVYFASSNANGALACAGFTLNF